LPLQTLEKQLGPGNEALLAIVSEPLETPLDELTPETASRYVVDLSPKDLVRNRIALVVHSGRGRPRKVVADELALREAAAKREAADAMVDDDVSSRGRLRKKPTAQSDYDTRNYGKGSRGGRGSRSFRGMPTSVSDEEEDTGSEEDNSYSVTTHSEANRANKRARRRSASENAGDSDDAANMLVLLSGSRSASGFSPTTSTESVRRANTSTKDDASNTPTPDPTPDISVCSSTGADRNDKASSKAQGKAYAKADAKTYSKDMAAAYARSDAKDAKRGTTSDAKDFAFEGTASAKAHPKSESPSGGSSETRDYRKSDFSASVSGATKVSARGVGKSR
jgi:hypothetical protein